MGHVDKHTDEQGEGHVTTEVKEGATQMQARDWQAPPEAARDRKDAPGSEGAWPCQHLISDIKPRKLGDNKLLLF